MLARFAGLGGSAEFLLNPVIGRMSDRFGRRPLLLLSPIMCALLRAGVFVFPGSSSMIMFERMLSSAVVTGFFSTMTAMLNDKLSMEDLVVARGAISIYAGMGVMLGPFIETLVLGTFGARGNFLAVAGINVVVGSIMFMTAKETLPLNERKSINLIDCSPLSFLKMFGTGLANLRLMLILLLQSFGEIRINQDINMLNLRENLKWTPSEVGRWMSGIGVSVVAGGKTVKPSISYFGMRGHTTLSNLVMALAFYIQGTRSKYFSQWGALALWFIGGRKRDAVEVICTELTLKNTDMGKGQVAAALSNFKSLAAIFGPPLAAKMYNYGVSIGNPGIASRGPLCH
jgi:DHA1 family tetracycline resistance protein-like MFS transporter